jgi:hypothetical protein
MSAAATDSEQFLTELDLLVKQVRSLAPPSCCPHNDPPCIGCGLAWLIDQEIPINLNDQRDLERVPAGGD